ncbi:tRNA adenosine(34) deaminase TadA [Oceaniserpentilla sp. 4NH20-0058]|uniref:tRNA adenosine(34) deaminase TadA n=1 Tax=Oceaniserpentilla sp. 4NH20-0058 TaxID=3127660 RepID=UPI0031088FF8
MNSDEQYMQAAIEQAMLADQLNEVPVGAVVVLDDQIIGRGFNQPITSHDPSAHAEIMALRQAAQFVENYRLVDADLYVTVEPCTMCSGAVVHSRIRRLIYGTTEPKAGVAQSQEQVFEKPYFNHQVDVIGGVLAQECTDVIQAFFKRRREEKKAAKK